jgi:hypothetical protein
MVKVAMRYKFISKGPTGINRIMNNYKELMDAGRARTTAIQGAMLEQGQTSSQQSRFAVQQTCYAGRVIAGCRHNQ